MDNMQQQLGAILNDPETMGKIMSMAQSLGIGQAEEKKAEQGAPPGGPELDPELLKKLSGLAGKSRLDDRQHDLLKALHPYLSGNRLRKLENAMRAAKIARLAAAVLGERGGNLFLFR